MAFVGNSSDILVLSKNSGEVHLIRDGQLQPAPVLTESVRSAGEQGMLTIATQGNKTYLYFTEAISSGNPPLAKRVYSYDWNGERLVNKTLVKEMPRAYYTGGAMTFDKNGTLYIAAGGAGRYGKLQHFPEGEYDGISAIHQLAPPGPDYAIGIRNSFGLTTDPVTGALWDSDNGDACCDEINMVTPKFNGGWDVIMGPASNTQLAMLPKSDYVYHDPKFTWETEVVPTGLAFGPNTGAFAKYNSSLFVASFINGNLYRFELNSQRNGFVFNSPQFKGNSPEVRTGDSMDEIIWGTGFVGITDVKFGPDGFLYLVSLPQGIIYRIVPATVSSHDDILPQTIANNYGYLVIAALGGTGIAVAYVIKGFRVKKIRLC